MLRGLYELCITFHDIDRGLVDGANALAVKLGSDADEAFFQAD